MQLFLTSVLPFLAHNHASAAAFLTCRHHNFHASIIPEFLSDEERVNFFYEARQKNRRIAHKETQFTNLYELFAQTQLMQFSPSLLLSQGDCAESILEPLLETKYFTRTLQRCTVLLLDRYQRLSTDLLQALSKVQSLTKLNLDWCEVKNEHLETIINSFPSLETLEIYEAELLRLTDTSNRAIKVLSPPPPATMTLQSLKLRWVDQLFVSQLVSNFPNLRKLVLSTKYAIGECDLRSLSRSLPRLTDLSLKDFAVKNTESLNTLVHLSSLRFESCRMPDSLGFLTGDSLPDLTTLCIVECGGLSTSSFACLGNASNLHELQVVSDKFDNDCLQYLENMIHLQRLGLSRSKIIGDIRSLKTLMQNMFQLEELNLFQCRIGDQGAVAGTLYSIHSRLRYLNLSHCDLVDHDLNGIGALKNTLEDLDLSNNYRLANEALVQCKDLVKLKILKLARCWGNMDLTTLKDCLNLEDLDVSNCNSLIDDSFRVFSEKPNSFPNLRVLNLSHCVRLTAGVFEHLSKNNHLGYQLKTLKFEAINYILVSSATALNNLCQLKGLRRLFGIVDDSLKTELLRRLKNLDYLL